MTSEPSHTPADIPLESSFETVVGLPGQGGQSPDETGPTKVSDAPKPSGPKVEPPPGFSAGAETNILPGSQSAAKPSDRPPTIPDVTLEKTLGQGGMGTVYKGRQITLDRAVAVKAIHPNLAADRTFVDRFEREAKVLAKLSHANIVTCYSAGTCRETGKHYLLMEYVEGEDLLKRVRKNGPLGERDAMIIARQVAEGLEHALEAGVIHRDVKPENILLKPVQGRTASSLGVQAKIVDLGLAALAQPDKEALRLTEAGTSLGTPLTMAPEQAEAPDSIDHRVDIYALGCTLFFALTGRFPHEGTTIAQVLSKKLRDETPNPKTLRPDLGDSTAKLVLQMMAFAPASRPATYEQLVAQLDAEIARLPGPSTGRLSSARIETSTNAGKEAAPGGDNTPVKLIAGVVLASIVVAGFLHWSREHTAPLPQ
ncbi:MAG: serine/threonine-protein kinase, partial [Planctomycetota bacterium]